MDIDQGFSYLSSLIFSRPVFEIKEAQGVHSALRRIATDRHQLVGLAIEAGQERQTLHVFTRVRTPPPAEISILIQLNQFDFPIAYTYTGRFIPAIRPATGGDSIGHFRGGSGTFGCTVSDQMGRTLILSCNHVLADVNRAVVGDVVLQPGVQQGGTLLNRIGELATFVPLVADGQTPNLVDAAAALVDDPTDVKDGIRPIGALTGTVAVPPLRAPVFKQGAATAWTSGQIVFRKAEVTVSYTGVGDVVMSDQYGVVGSNGLFSDRGDSGAIVVDANSRAIGMVIGVAEDANVTLVTPIGQVLTDLKATIR
jgi:hypothetical protein